MKTLATLAVALFVTLTGAPHAFAGYLTLPLASTSLNSYFDHQGPYNCFDTCVASDNFVRYDGGTWTNAQTNFATGCTYGLNCYNGHDGTDFEASSNTPVLAAADGVVQLVTYMNGFGNIVRIWHASQGYSTFYAHLTSQSVVQGASVTRGQEVGKSGNTGGTFSPHLHFGVYDAQTNGHAIDPFGWSGGTSDPNPYTKGYLWSTTPPSSAPPPSGGGTGGIPTIGVGYNLDGRMVVGARGADGHVYTIEQAQSGTNNWQSFQNHPGSLIGNPVFGHNSDGRVELFIRNQDNQLYNLWETSPNGAWSSSWGTFGGSTAGDPAVASNQNGMMQFFYVDPSNHVFTNYQLTGGGWNGNASVPGTLSPMLAMTQNQDARLELIGRGTDAAFYHNWQVSQNSAWAGWQGMGGSVPNKPVIAMDQFGRLEVFVLGGDGHIDYQVQQGPSNETYGPWSVIPNGNNLQSNPAVGIMNGQLTVVVRGGDNSFYYTSETSIGTWTAWTGMNCNVSSDPAIGYSSGGGFYVYARGNNGVLYYEYRPGAGAWSGWSAIGDGISRF